MIVIVLIQVYGCSNVEVILPMIILIAILLIEHEELLSTPFNSGAPVDLDLTLKNAEPRASEHYVVIFEYDSLRAH
jgi:hypothetical protein